MTPADVASSPAIVYLGIVVAALVMAAGAFPKVLGPISTSIADWARRRREAAIEREDADLADLRRQVRHLTTRLGEVERHHDEWLQVTMTHAAWDWSVYQACLAAGVPVERPPALRPRVEPAEGPEAGSGQPRPS